MLGQVPEVTCFLARPSMSLRRPILSKFTTSPQPVHYSRGDMRPATASKITLKRGKTATQGHIVWQSGALICVEFDLKIDMAEWLSTQPPSGPQNEVNLMTQKSTTSGEIEHPSAESRSVSAYQIVETKALLESLAEELAGEANLVARIGCKLQSLDIAAQLLGKLAAER